MEGASTTGPAYDIAQAAYDSKSFVATETGANARSLIFNADGTKVYTVGVSNDTVYQYSLSTAYDISTAVYDTISFSFASQDLNPAGMYFKSDGTKLYMVGQTGDDTIYQYSLSTAYNVGTASYDSVSFNISGQQSSSFGLEFSPDGTKFYIAGNSPQALFQYTLSTAWDMSTASYASKTFVYSSQTTLAPQIRMNAEGSKMFLLDYVNKSVLQYSLPTAYDISTASYDSVEFDVSNEISGTPFGLDFSSTGSKMYVMDADANIYQYSSQGLSYINQMDKTQLDAVTDPNHIALGNDLDLAIVFNMTSGATVPSSDGVAINYDANVLNKGAVLGTDYDFDAPTQSSVRITALAGNNLKVRVV
jgi:hypothetical protein